MQNSSDVEKFPFLSKELNYYELTNNELVDLGRNENLIKEAYFRAKNNKSTLFATWHGTYRTDMFLINNLSAMGQSFGFEKPLHLHDISWSVKDGNSRSAYATVDLKFNCGCKFDGAGQKEQLKRDLLIQKGWEMSSSAGIGGYDGKYLISVLKKSIKD